MEVNVVIHARRTPNGSLSGKAKVQCSKRHEMHLDWDWSRT
jgi:hypothetical protein